VKTFLKILAALAAVVVLFLGWSYARYRQNEYRYCTLTLAGEISPETFVQFRECLVRAETPKKTFVVTGSGGGDNFSALALGILIHRHGWDVEIVDYCLSACATFIFPAGKTKYLHRQSMLMFHGGPHQENLLEQAKENDRRTSMNRARTEFVTLPQANEGAARTEFVTLARSNKENSVSVAPITPAYLEVHEFLSIPVGSTSEEIIAWRKAADQFYEQLGITTSLPTYGQLGGYESTYKSGKYQGFLYRLDSLRRFGIDNVELKDGEWHPERHFLYPQVYEVTYP